MNLFDVYPLMNVTPVKAKDCVVWDDKGNEYLDLYGGHAVISIGHSHPHYIKRITGQLNNIGFYSNSVQNPLQVELGEKLGKLSGLENYSLFLCNSGAEANENALKLASFHTGKKRVIAFGKGFHGRTSAAVAVTDNSKIQAEVNKGHHSVILPLNDLVGVKNEIANGDVCAVIIEGIQGIGGIRVPEAGFLTELDKLCRETGTVLILDEIQSGYGRSGSFFAFEASNISPDIITTAKGMGNGFPVGGVLISPSFEASHGLLGTTFGGNYLACAASLAVLEVMEEQKLIENARNVGQYLMDELGKLDGISEVRGSGLMIGIEFEGSVAPIRKALLDEKRIFTGVSSTNVIRLLPPLTLTHEMASRFLESFSEVYKSPQKTL
ncbi:aspartate aminotransferase family protein [Alkalitalea saponilacus]|uniref:Acetylornithine aminotransferase n=1 Tax=Alkalitalea saponilacus TaxID=889453 RepID=A0A1T5AM90_9BACT|nr:aminotransferase class III-fold pyridoxal phosphate-dependent enzyme [Alkalitalea saponilacus]ASB48653.1 aspartate aminotransferase family protein [Alkalitalea saponilacus]SKB36122.1 acetylornithine aminotransferase [Alkalitalea saponilacus]